MKYSIREFPDGRGPAYAFFLLAVDVCTKLIESAAFAIGDILDGIGDDWRQPDRSPMLSDADV